MEFHTLGKNCQKPGCNQIDFLPLQCQCDEYFCREHFMEHCLSGLCKVAPKPKENNRNIDSIIYTCTSTGCKKGSFIEMLCRKCELHFCIEHRFHPQCPEIDPETLAIEKAKWDRPREEYLLAKEKVDAKITENFRKALQSTKAKTALKVHLMRLKQKAKGAKTIPTQDRLYFAIFKPKNNDSKDVYTVKSAEVISEPPNVSSLSTVDDKDFVPVFVSKTWSLGRAMDAICDMCLVKNENNNTSGPKIRLFRQLDGYCISPSEMNVLLTELLDSEVLVDGDKLTLEYVSNEDLGKSDGLTHIFLKLPIDQ